MNIKRQMVKLGARLIPFSLAKQAARYFLATQGIGYATDVEDSGELLAARRFLSPGSVVFDIGANTGRFTENLLDTGAIFHLFEPSAEHFQEIRRLQSEQVRLNRIGLSDETTTMTLNKDQAITGLATLIDRDLAHCNIELDIRETVHVIRGDSYCAEHGINRISYMKIDVEGWEMPVLCGFGAMFSRGSVTACQIEFGHAHLERRENFRDFFRWFTERDYQFHAIKPDGALHAIQVYDELFETYYATNYLAVRSE